MEETRKLQLLNEHRFRLLSALGRPGGGLYRQYLGREIRQRVDFTSSEIKEACIKYEKNKKGIPYFSWEKQCPKEIELDSTQREALMEIFADLPADQIDQVIMDLVFQLVESRAKIERILKIGEKKRR